MLRLPHSARWDITNICNFPPPSQTSQTFAKYWKKPPRSLYLDKLFLQRKSSRYFQTIRFASLHLSEFVQNCAPSNLSDECFHRFAFIQFAQRWVDLIDARLSGQIGKCQIQVQFIGAETIDAAWSKLSPIPSCKRPDLSELWVWAEGKSVPSTLCSCFCS